jgi:uncharacterized protein (TIGR02145 family)
MNKLIKYYLAIFVIIVVTILTGCQKEKKATIPILSTTAVSNITATTASSGGNITNDGDATVITHGVCWSTGITPSIADNKTSDGAGAGSFTSIITNLNGGTIYYVRAYATNGMGTGYGVAMSFTTLGQTPSPSVSAASNINITSATLNGSVNANYLSTVVTFEYGTTTSYGSSVTATQSPLTGSINSNVSADITGLTTGTTYHYRVKAVNSLGTDYSDDITFTTLGQVPTVTSLPSTNINVNIATLNGSVNANYLSTVVTFEYGTSTSYGSAITATQSPLTGSTNSNVSADITGLTAGTTYHYRIKAVNSLGTAYSDDITFITLGNVPSVVTLASTTVTTTTATLNGVVNANYLGSTVTFEYGLTTGYGTTATATQSPVIGNANTNVSASISGLSIGTTYHYRVKAVNSLGTVYGIDLTFSTVPTTVNDVEGNTYNVIAIGGQIWMAENLKTTKYNDGTTVPNITDNTSWTTLITPAYCWYNNDISNKTTYGALYNWYTVDAVSTGNKNICPTGWHVPSDAEWTTLTNYLGGESIAGGKLKEIGTTHWESPNTGATNESGFTALPSGYRSFNGITFDNLGLLSYWWSNIEADVNNSSVWYTLYSSSSMVSSIGKNKNGYSVRCLRDN